MSRLKSLQEMFKRYRRPGDIVFATTFLLMSLFLLSQIESQSPWRGTRQIFSQPAFWPTVSLAAMTFFAFLHFLSSAWSLRRPGRWQEVWQWVRALEYAGWFLVYVAVVPRLGYLPTTMLAAFLLALRAGYRRPRHLVSLLVLGVVIVITFRGFLQVRIPAGAIYEYLPASIRVFWLTYL
jgi:hypothetical protein